MARNILGLLLRPWASSSDARRRTPENAGIDRADGWTIEYSTPGGKLPEGDVFNQLFGEITGLLHDVKQHGVIEWSSEQSYDPPAISLGSDGVLYLTTGNVGHTVNPATRANDNVWHPIIPKGTTTQEGVVRLATVAEDMAGVDNTIASTPAGARQLVNTIVASSASFFVGESKDLYYTPNPIPTGWLPCDGRAVSRTTYAALWAAIGSTYGNGNGTTTFNLPDRRRRVLMGSGGTRPSNSSGPGSNVGNIGGSETHTLSVNQMPAHTHGSGSLTTSTETPLQHIERRDGGGNGIHEFVVNPPSTSDLAEPAGGHSHDISGSTASRGSFEAHNNVPPSIVVFSMIYAGV